MSTTELLAGSVSGAKAKTCTLDIDDPSAVSDWLRMFDRDREANPYQHPDYVRAELEGRIGGARLAPVVVRSGNEFDCDGLGVLLPKQIRTSQVGGVGLQWTMHGYRLSGGRFLTSANHDSTQSVLLTLAIRQCIQAGAEFLLIEDLDDQSHLAQAVQQEVTKGLHVIAVREAQPRWRIAFPVVEEDYWKTFSSRTRRAFRSRLKKFGQTQLDRITRIDQIPTFLSAAHEISKQSWQSRQFGLRIKNDDQEAVQLATLAQHGFLRSYLWQVEGRPAAFALCHQHRGYFRYEEIAYCARFSPLSPGETMLQQIVEDLYRHDLPRLFDFGGGDAEYKRRFGNLESRSQSVWLVPPTWRASASLMYLNSCRGLRSSVRSVVKACGLATKARQWLRYGGRATHPKASELITPVADSTSDDDVQSEGKLS